MQDTITIRPTVPKAELERLSGGDLNRWINGLIENAVRDQAPDWQSFFERPWRKVTDQADAVRRVSR